MRNLIRFLEDGDKAKVTLRFRGREITHQEIGLRLLERVRDDLIDVGQVEQMPKMEGRQMVMVGCPEEKMISSAGLWALSTKYQIGNSRRLHKWVLGSGKLSGYLVPGYKGEGAIMPKMKTKTAAAKRFKIRPGGSIKRAQAFKRHILTKKSTKTKRGLRGLSAVSHADRAAVRAMLPYA